MNVLVVFHIYYPEFARYYLDQLKNIHSCNWKLIVTGVSFSEDMIHQVRSVKSDAEFLNVENRGYDIWPFISAVKTVNLSDFDFVIKLHTKNQNKLVIRLNGMNMDGNRWKELLVSEMLGSKDKFTRLLKIFRERPNVGIAYNRQLDFVLKEVNPEDCEMLDDEIARLGINRKKCHFCAGTMFAVRASALEFLNDAKINAGTFDNSGPSHGCATMAHVYERLLPIAVQSLDLKYQPLYDSALSAVIFAIKDFFTPIAEWIFWVNFYRGREQKRIVIFGFNIIVKVK